MPNICSNYLRVKGQPDAATEFLVRLQSGGFGAFIPEPLDSDNEWRSRHWGDKWDIGDHCAVFDTEHLKCLFATAWQPPTAWFRHVAALYRTLTFELWYEESGNQLWGWMKSEGGILTLAREEPLSECDEGSDECQEEGPMFDRAASWYLD